MPPKDSTVKSDSKNENLSKKKKKKKKTGGKGGSSATATSTKTGGPSPETKEEFVPAFNAQNAYYGGQPEGIVILDKPPALGGQPIPTESHPKDFQWANTLFVEKGQHHVEGDPKIQVDGVDTENGKCFKDIIHDKTVIKKVTDAFLQRLHSKSIPPVILAQMGPYGIGAFFDNNESLKQGDCLDYLVGRYVSIEELESKSRALTPKENEYQQVISTTHIMLCDQERSSISLLQDLLSEEDLKKLSFYPPELAADIQTQNIEGAKVTCEDRYPVILYFISQYTPLAPIGYPYGKEYWQAKKDAYSVPITKQGSGILSVLYAGDLIFFDIETQTEGGEAISLKLEIDRKFLLYKIKHNEDFSPTITCFGQRIKIPLTVSGMRKKLTDLGHIPSKPENLSDNLALDFVKAAAADDLKTMIYLLEWADPKFTNINYVVEPTVDANTGLVAGDTALHTAITKGHLRVVLYLLNNQADLTLRDANGRTALELADTLTDKKIFNYLRNHQARMHMYRLQYPTLEEEEKVEKERIGKLLLQVEPEMDQTSGKISIKITEQSSADYLPPPLYRQPIKLETAKEKYKVAVEETLSKLTESVPTKNRWKCNDALTKAWLTVSDEEHQNITNFMRESCSRIVVRTETRAVLTITQKMIVIDNPDLEVLKKLLVASKLTIHLADDDKKDKSTTAIRLTMRS